MSLHPSPVRDKSSSETHLITYDGVISQLAASSLLYVYLLGVSFAR